MRSVGIVSVFLGLLIVISRGLLAIFPAAMLRWFEGRIASETRTRWLGMALLPIAVAMIWAGNSDSSGLAGVLMIFGIFMLFAIAWLVLAPRTYMAFCSGFLPSDPEASLFGWRLAGLFGAFIGGVIVYFGWLAL